MKLSKGSMLICVHLTQIVTGTKRKPHVEYSRGWLPCGNELFSDFHDIKPPLKNDAGKAFPRSYRTTIVERPTLDTAIHCTLRSFRKSPRCFPPVVGLPERRIAENGEG